MRKLALILTLLLSLALAACQPAAPTMAPEPTQPAAEPTEPPAPPAEPFRVAVVMPSAINDLAFSQSMYDALVRVQEQMGGEANFEIAY
jgi:basic membrane protein A